MWKYITKKQCNDFLLSLHLIDNKNTNEYLKELYSISNNIENNYKTFKIKKNNGKYRNIYEPNKTLKYIQRQILNKVLCERKVSKFAKAYIKGTSLKENALPHIGQKKILKLDIKDFFNNITFEQIYNSCFPIDYYPKNIGVLLTKLVTYYDFLPQGAPTSSYISNVVMKNFDEIVGNYCIEKHINYTRYSDDITISGDFNISEIIKLINKELRKLGFQINKNKTNVINKSQMQNVTGLVVNEKVGVPKKYKNNIRKEVYYINKFGLKSHLKNINYNKESKEYLQNLYGRILYVIYINKTKEFLDYKIVIEKLKEKH